VAINFCAAEKNPRKSVKSVANPGCAATLQSKKISLPIMDSAFVLNRTKCDPVKTKADKLTKQSGANLIAVTRFQPIYFLKFCENFLTPKNLIFAFHQFLIPNF
jgi:hypothetical protein